MKTHELSNQTQILIDRAFVMHPSRADQEDRVRHIHDRIESMTRQLATLMPDSTEQREMIKCLREAMFWGQEAIVKNEIGGKP
jgi:hypothetical protein